jgi:beta-galactosidase
MLGALVGGGVFADQVIKFDTAWQFFRGTPTGTPQSPSFSDASWQTVYLPHPDSVLLNTTTWLNYLGYCWYRKTFTPSAAFQGKKVFLEIEAAMQTTLVYVNDSLLTTHLGGYTPIVLDITKYLNFTGSNVIAIQLNNTPEATFPPGNSTPDFLYFGGLYRNVYLHLADSLHITNAILVDTTAGGGIFVTNSSVTTGAASAMVYVKTHIVNQYTGSKTCGLTTSIRNAAGAVVATHAAETATLAAGASTTFHDTLTVPNPQLWSPGTPNLYSVHSVVSNGSAFADSLNTTIGIRTIFFSKANGFTLNGARFKWRGANRHQSFPYLGNALPNSGQYRDVLRMKEYGINFVRTCHYAQAPSFFDACDRLGVLVQACLPGWQFWQNTTPFITNSLAALRDMIHYYRNHPSVILWEAMMNESTPTAAYLDSAEALAHRECPRIATGDSGIWTCGEESNGNGILDVYISSTQHGVLGYTGARPCAVSEYADWNLGCSWTGAMTSPVTGCQDRVSRINEDSMINQSMNQAVGRSENLGVSWLTGDALWSMFDYQTWEPDPLTTSGCIDLFRIPKYSAYFFQSQRSPGDTLVSAVKGGPMVFIASRWTSTSPLKVRVFSNCDSVSLYLNSTLVATQGPGTGDTVVNLEHPYFTFTVPAFKAGTLMAQGKIGGVVAATYQVSTPGTAKSISIAIDTAGLQLAADGSDIAIIYASVLDSNGQVVPTAANSITFAITGGTGTLIGVNPMAAQAGIATILLRAGTTPGPITVTASATGLGTPATATVTSVAPSSGTGTVTPFVTTTSAAQKEGFSIRRTGSVLCVYAPLQLVGSASSAKFSIYNAQGRLIGRWDLAGGVTAVKMTSLPHGIYLGQITNNGGKFMQKIIW